MHWPWTRTQVCCTSCSINSIKTAKLCSPSCAKHGQKHTRKLTLQTVPSACTTPYSYDCISASLVLHSTMLSAKAVVCSLVCNMRMLYRLSRSTDLMLAMPDAGLCTWCTQVGASASALPMHALSSAGSLAWRAGRAAMAGLATLMATQQGSAAFLAALHMLAACKQNMFRARSS